MATNKQLAELMGALDTAGKTNAEIVISAYEQLFNRTPDTDGMNYWVGRLDAGLSTTDLQAALLDGVRFYEGTFAAEAIADLAITSSKRTVADALLAAGVTGAEAATFLAGVTDAATRDAALADIEAAHPTDPTDPTDPVDPTEAVTVSLDTKSNNVAGEAGDDTFYAFVQQNEAGTGTVANALSTGDFIDGKGGWDVVDATMINDQKTPTDEDFFPMPVMANVEEIRIQALDAATVGTFDDGVTLDADRITGEEHYASDRSRGDLTITNVNLDADQITKDIVIEMKNTQQNSDMAVYFNEQDLIAAPAVTTQSAEFFIQVADGNAQDDTKPLDNIKFDLSFTQGTETHTFEGLSAVNGTYEGLVATIEAALAGKGLTGYTVSLGNSFDSFTTDTGTSFPLDYTGYYVNVADNNGEPFTDIEFTPSQKSGTTLAIILAQSEIDAASTTLTNRVETSIILDGVGRGSNGGELVVGSTSASASSTGIEVFNIVVEHDSVIHDISTTNDDGRTSWDGFQTINLTNGTVKGDFVLTNALYNDGDTGMYGNVTDHDGATADFKDGLNDFNATNFEGDIVLGRDNDIMNLGTLNANVVGNVTYHATMDDAATHVAVTGSGNDLFDISLDASSDITINTGNGTNTVNLDEVTLADNTVAVITGGSGVDTINGEAVSITVNAGASNDLVYAENTGLKAVATHTNTWTVAIPANDGAIDTAGTVHFLAGKQVQVTVAVGNAAVAIGADNYTVGFESALVTINPSSGALTTIADFNNAVLKAVNEDAVLNKIVTASISGNNVVFTYLVDGVQDAGSIVIDVTAPSTLAATASAAMTTEYRDLVNDSSTDVNALWAASNVSSQFIAVTVAGTDSIDADNQNVINGQEGNDVIILDSESTLGDTVVFTGYSQGNDTIVHFETTVDQLDFTAYLTGTVPSFTSGSTSAESEVALSNTAAATLAFTADSINLVQFNALTGMVGTATFESMTIAQLEAALEAADATTTATAGLYQTKGISVLIIEDAASAVVGDIDNAGTYKAYEISYANTTVAAGATDFTVKLIGSFDLGEDVLVTGDLAL
jgi:hypothetical protein